MFTRDVAERVHRIEDAFTNWYIIEAQDGLTIVDAGVPGSWRSLLDALGQLGRPIGDVRALVLTHGHFDHVLGIPGLFSTLRLRQSTDVITIHGSPATLDVVVRMLAGLWGEGRAPIALQLVPLAVGRILDAGDFTVDCFRVRHRDTESFAFSFESQVRRHLLPDRLSALGVPDGPVRKDLAERKPVVLADGRTIDSEDVLDPPNDARSSSLWATPKRPTAWPSTSGTPTSW